MWISVYTHHILHEMTADVWSLMQCAPDILALGNLKRIPNGYDSKLHSKFLSLKTSSNNKESLCWGWRDGSGVKSPGSSSRGPGSSQQSVTLVPGYPVLLSDLQAPDTHTVYRQTCGQSTPAHKENENKSLCLRIRLPGFKYMTPPFNHGIPYVKHWIILLMACLITVSLMWSIEIF